MSASSRSDSSKQCPCTETTTSEESLLDVHCKCPEDDHGIVTHEKTCLLYKHERIIFPPVEVICEVCSCPVGRCLCKKSGREAFDQWRSSRPIGAMPAVLESTHPLMQKFQESLKQFLIKENNIAEQELLNLREELRLSKQAYENDLESLYTRDHDTNAQRVLISEYESTLVQRTAEREAAEKRARESNEKYKRTTEKLEQDLLREREATEELEALTNLCNQLETWRQETDSDLTVSQRMSDKMRAEKQALAEEKRQLDMLLYGLNNEIWKLESKLEMFKKQIEIKNGEMEKINDKVTAYAAELEDLELDKRRLMSLWNSVIANIKQRDLVFDSVRDDYKTLQENYRTLLSNLEITKKVTMEEMEKSKELSLNKDKLILDNEHATKLHDNEDAKRISLELQMEELTEAIEMTERDQEMIKMENNAMKNALRSTEKDLERKVELKRKLENEILTNMQDCLLNDKAVESMANGIRKMRELSKKQELALMAMENQHAKVMLDIEVYRNRQAKNNLLMEENLAKVKAREQEIDGLQEDFDQKALVITRKQRELDIVTKKFLALKEIFDMKSPQERRIEELEQQVRSLRERTESMQHEWLRLQGHVVKLTDQHHKLVSDINLINKQIQICEQKIMRNQAECEGVMTERARVERSLRELRSRLEVLERTRKDAIERNEHAHRSNLAMTHECAANLKDAETEIIQLEEDIEEMDKLKMNLTQELDKVQKEALIWQRKGILAVELKRNISNAKSAAGDIGRMKTEIHRMEVRREQLRRTSEKLAEDLSLYVSRRDNALEKTRATAAAEKAHGPNLTSQSSYHHKLRLAKADVARVTKELAEAKFHMEQLQKEQERLDLEVAEMNTMNSKLEEHVADLIRECHETDRTKQWLLERVVRSQRLGSELSTAIKRQSVKTRKSKNTVLAEYNQAKSLNERLQYIVDTLQREYPHMTDKFETIRNTLNIYTPSSSPRLTGDAGDCERDGREMEVMIDESNVAEKPFCSCDPE